jgi:AcrR family transcriptional regulator
VARPDPTLAALGEQVARGAVAGRRDRYEQEVVTLIRAVHRLTRRRTYAEATVAEILEEAGLSTRAFYRHFESKDELLVAVFHYETALSVDQLAAAVSGADDAAAGFDRWVDWYLELVDDPRRLVRFMVLQQEHDRLSRLHGERMHALDLQRDAVLVSVLARGVADGSFPAADPERDAPVVHALVIGLLRRVAAGEASDSADVRRQLLRFCLPALRGR